MKTKPSIRILAAFSALLLGSVALTACAQASPKSLATYQAQTIEWKSCDPSWLLGTDRQSDAFKAGDTDCATMLAPARYDQPGSAPDFKIAMARLKATGERLGTLFLNPGGPGQSGLEQVQWIDLPEKVRQHFDVIGFDPRGVNLSDFADGSEIKCDNETDYVTYWAGEMSPANVSEMQESIKLSDEYTKKCVADNPYWYTMSTANVVEDLELMRQTITGDEPLNFLGSSYGTTIAAAYVSTYPQHVGKVILDSPTSTDPFNLENVVAEASAFEKKLAGWIKGYATYANMSVPEVQQLLLDIRQQGDDDKLFGFAGMKVFDAQNNAFYSNEAMFLKGIQTLAYYPQKDAQDAFNQGIDQLREYQWNGVFEWIGLDLDGYDVEALNKRTEYSPKDLKRDNSFEVMLIVNQMDVAWPDLTVEQQKEMAAAVRKAAPFWTKLQADSSGWQYFGEDKTLSFADFALKDDAIPDPPKTYPARTNTSGKKLLIVGSKYESVTPFAFAEKTAKELSSPLVTFEGSEHAPVAGFKNECLTKIFVDYLVNNIDPQEGATCKP